MNITDFDRQLFKNRNGKNAGDLSGRVNKIIEDKIYVKNEEEAFCVMENATDEVYVKLESVEADKLSFTDPICTAFIEKRGMYLPDKSINIDYFAYLNDKYEDDISLHSLPWKFDEYLKKLEDRVQSIGNPTIRRFQAFGKFLLFALIGSVVAYLSQLAVFDGHKDFLSLICWVPFLLGLLTLGGCAVTAFYYLFHGAVENYEYNELKNAYLNAMKYVRCRALWFQKTRNTDSVPEYLIVAEGRVRFASEPVKKMIKKLLNIEYNKSADPIADKDLLYDALEDLKESKEDKSFELIKKAEDFEEKGDKENAYLQYIASLKCGDSLALAKACQLACELADENNDLEKIYECVYLADSFGIAEDAFKEDLYEGLHCYYMEQFIPLYQAYNKEGDKVKKNELKRKCDEVKAKLGFCNVMLARYDRIESISQLIIFSCENINDDKLEELCGYFKRLTDLVNTKCNDKQRKSYENAKNVCSYSLSRYAAMVYSEKAEGNNLKIENIKKGERFIELISDAGMPFVHYYFAYTVYMPLGYPTRALESAIKARDLGCKIQRLDSLINALAADNPYRAFGEWKRQNGLE